MTKYRLAVFIAVALLISTGLMWYTFQLRQNEFTLNEDSRGVSSDDDTGVMFAQMEGEEFDKAYLADMIAHHQSALNMASKARSLSDRSEIQTFADGILTSQSAEVRHMMDLQAAWGYIDGDDPHAGHAMEGGGSMAESMALMEAKLEGLTGKAFDREFLSQMILHHRQAVDMSHYAATNAKRQEIKNLADEVIKQQEKEIVVMELWQKWWGY